MTNPPAECPRCHGHSFRTADTRLNRDGRRRRRYRCHSCEYRWTVWEGERSQSPPKKNPRRPLSPDKVRLILLSPLSSCSLAKQLGCSHEAVCAVRRGDTHAGLWPEIPRQRARTGPLCLDCSRWRGGASPCKDEVPEAKASNPGFAAECELFDPRAGWEERQRIRAQLTEQAAVARQTGPH
jgi:transposase-like protein